ncbi:hypothetical protein PC128_g27592 [Phytophthora cactorum]|nr:hypothetical protein PC120_g28087 [Phytophthora cactorum]KAG3019701.1 hypothetical protein PC121_g24953 [Phytophthora cactorum]KAG3123700.1 hypothetical protein PC128_g27592 [Phytophthora cactorum]KAG4036053.1 hypothetical protein PC123_g28379 [Phytophthora cactorum]
MLVLVLSTAYLGLAFSVDDSTADVLCVFCGMIRPGV